TPDPRNGGLRAAVSRTCYLPLVPRDERAEAPPTSVERLLGDVIRSDAVAAVGGLVGDLRPEHARAEHGDCLDVRRHLWSSGSQCWRLGCPAVFSDQAAGPVTDELGRDDQ